MDYEKKYKEALERMKSWAKGEHPECFSEAQKTAEFIFPELAESKDERIRNSLLSHIRNTRCVTEEGAEQVRSWIAWLEKQGNKSVNIDVESMVSSYKQRVVSQYNGVRNNPLVNMCLTSFRHGVENVLEELNLKKLEKQGEPKESDEEWEVTTGLYKCTKRMFDGTPESRLWFEIGNLYKCVSKNDIAEFESSYGHTVFLIDPVVRKHFIKVKD